MNVVSVLARIQRWKRELAGVPPQSAIARRLASVVRGVRRGLVVVGGLSACLPAAVVQPGHKWSGPAMAVLGGLRCVAPSRCFAVVPHLYVSVSCSAGGGNVESAYYS